MTRNVAEHVREKIARQTRIADTQAALLRARYAELVRDALASIARYESRIASGTEHTIPTSCYTDAELAWFRRPVCS